MQALVYHSQTAKWLKNFEFSYPILGVLLWPIYDHFKYQNFQAIGLANKNHDNLSMLKSTLQRKVLLEVFFLLLWQR